MATHEKKKYVPIGIDDFQDLIEGDYYFVDKSLLIKELLDSKAKVTLLPRPRRFGKTLNLSMLQYFFEKTEKSNRHLFTGLNIEQCDDCLAQQGKYPVIWLTLKDVKTDTWAPCYEKIRTIIGAEFSRHLGMIKPVLSNVEMVRVDALIAGTASQATYENALLDLSVYLERAYQSRVVILLDEYDAPIHAGYLKGYYNEVINFMRGFLGAGLKGNKPLNFSVLTGILRVAKESIFSGINNLEVCTMLCENYDDKFGFLETEVVAMLTHFGLENQLDEVRSWYNGYQSGTCKVYNPWSIINLAKIGGIIQAYWVNTSDNALIKDLLRKCTPEMKEDLEIIAKGGRVTKPIQENIVMPDIDKNDDVLWSFLLFCGYLTFENYRREERSWLAELHVPNEEVVAVYETSFKNWFLDSTGIRDYTNMLEYLTDGQAMPFKKSFERFCRETLSYFDVKGDEPERFYHALVLGMLASLSKTHEVRSNRESGYGRYDVMLIPKDRAKTGVIIEFKSIDEGTLETAVQNALKQIDEQGYETELRALGITNILKVGIAFKGKESLVLIG